MDLINLALFGTSAITFYFIILVFFGAKKDLSRLLFGVLLIVAALWPAIIAMFRSATTTNAAHFWAVMIYVVGAAVGPSFSLFAYLFASYKKISLKLLLILILPLILLFYFLIFTDYWIKNIELNDYGNKVFLGEIYWLWVLYFMGCMGWSFMILFKRYKKAEGIGKTQLKYIIIGMFFPGFGSTPYNVILPYFGDYEHIWIGPFFVAILTFVIGYAILRCRLMDIRWIIGRTGTYLLSLATTILYVFLLLFFYQRFKSFVSLSTTSIFMVLSSILLFTYTLSLYKKLAARYFYYTFYNLQVILQKLGEELNKTIKVGALARSINSDLLESLKLDTVGVVLKQLPEGKFLSAGVIKLKEEDLLSLLTKEENFLAKYLQQTKEPLAREEIPYIIKKQEAKIGTEEERKSFADYKQKLLLAKQQLDELKLGLVLPLFMGEELIGIITLGDKLSGEAYTVQDLNLLTLLSVQAAVAFNNALSYEEIEQRKAELEKFYKLTVGRELRMAELKEKIKKLEERK